MGGSFSQLSYYAYSVATLFAFLWALRIVKSVSATSAFDIVRRSCLTQNLLGIGSEHANYRSFVRPGPLNTILLPLHLLPALLVRHPA